jgi:aryl-phospho-beta-D-glucosidase BglC (GH1 family)
VTQEDGSTFTYTNKFGGYWVSDPNDPLNNNARPNSWTPPLNQSWTWGKDRVFGVNLGGLFVLEPFISPALFQKYPGAVDEWTLSNLMRADTANGGINQLEDHYNTFVTEADIAEIAGAGLNWIRLPVPFWAIETWPGEPFLAQTSWKYILRLFGWCRKYGIRVKLDLHTIPGSQNGYNHSGKLGKINFLNGAMGIANAQRALEYIRVFTEFISQPQYKDVVPVFGIMNEALLSDIGRPQLSSFYLEAHNMIRGITGYGEGNGPYISIHDGFAGLSSWADFLPGSDRIALDTHPYFAFDGSSATAPIDTGTGNDAGGVWPAQVCNRWAAGINSSRSNFGVTIAGEFSNGFNDCGLFLKGVSGRSTTYGGNCDDWQDSSNWSAATKAGLQKFAEASMDALGDWFFWTWKVGNSTAGMVESPLWSYQLGFRNGWMPKDPRSAIGTCASLGVDGPMFDGAFLPWQTGGAGAGTIAPTATASFPWPPATISNVDAAVSLLPSYTPTATVVSLPPPTFSASATPATKSIDVGKGWFNSQDSAGAPTPIAGCTYPPDPWDAVDAVVPPPCGGGAR